MPKNYHFYKIHHGMIPIDGVMVDQNHHDAMTILEILVPEMIIQVVADLIIVI